MQHHTKLAPLSSGGVPASCPCRAAVPPDVGSPRHAGPAGHAAAAAGAAACAHRLPQQCVGLRMLPLVPATSEPVQRCCGCSHSRVDPASCLVRRPERRAVVVHARPVVMPAGCNTSTSSLISSSACCAGSGVVFAELLSGRLVVCCCGGAQRRTPCDDIAPPLRVLSAWSHACPALLQLVPQQHTTRCDALMFLVHPRVASSHAQCLHSPHGMQLQRTSTAVLSAVIRC
jgi:hypothetical protein